VVLASKEAGVQLVTGLMHQVVAMVQQEGGVLLLLQQLQQLQLLLRVLLVQLLQLWQGLLGDLLAQPQLLLLCQCLRRILTLRWAVGVVSSLRCWLDRGLQLGFSHALANSLKQASRLEAR
jgi:hypothetical protein